MAKQGAYKKDNNPIGHSNRKGQVKRKAVAKKTAGRSHRRTSNDDFDIADVLIGGLFLGSAGVLLGMFASSLFSEERNESESFAKVYGGSKNK
ncbi:MAG: hypothetical protein IPK18_02415 [Sphingobacteriales bacterium]|nr:MAG: hypothetical protein IPK18_02415 [Sphingobacteriales bacterium]